MIRTKDIIVIASLINIAVVALILATSVQKRSDIDSTQRFNQKRFQEPVQEVIASTHARTVKKDEPLCLDEIDALLQQYERAPDVAVAQEIENQSLEYQQYIIKKGDSPWKIARRFGMPFEELLEINGLNATSAKNLKIGQTIKVKKSTQEIAR